MTQTSSQADPRSAKSSGGESSDRHDRPALERYPILIGISGKRIFDTDVAADCAIADALAKRFRTLFEALDRDLPETPKIVVTGAAFGTDLIAAETALGIGRDWAVAAVLPFDRVLFEQDFQPSPDEEPAWHDRYAAHLRTFERVLGSPDKPHHRVLVRELPKLAVADGVATAAQLSRQGAQRDQSLRRNHYEQVGQFIAEISTIMIAVMSSDAQPDTSEANGGTARIVACRRAGGPDAVGTAVARRSSVLRFTWPEVKPLPGGYVWLMDPRKSDFTGHYPVEVLPPLLDRCADDVYAGHPGEDMAEERATFVGPLRALANGLRAALPLRDHDLEHGVRSRRLRASLAVARGFERYHREGSGSRALINDKAVADASPVASVPEALNSARSHFSSRQRKVNSYVKRGFFWLAFLFVAAVFIFEIATQLFNESRKLLALYLGILGLIGVRALYARWKLWEAVAEDYRAVAEILRVQRAWWLAGLPARADREHLQGVDQDLAPIRDCAKTIIAWILLRHGWKEDAPGRDWADVRGTAAEARDLHQTKKPPNDWIGSQLRYFIKSGENRERRVHIIDAASWCLFVVSGILAAVLLTWIAVPGAMSMFEHMAHIRLPAWASFIEFDISPFVWILLALLTIGFRIWNHDIRRGLAAIVLTGVVGALAAVAVALALVSAGPHIAHVADIKDVERAVRFALISGLVVLSAGAGALRYLMERLNIEAEALDYRDALGRFERAERRLARGSDPATGAPADQEAAKRIIYELGCLALAENEAWLKSRRERPLTPVVG